MRNSATHAFCEENAERWLRRSPSRWRGAAAANRDFAQVCLKALSPKFEPTCGGAKMRQIVPPFNLGIDGSEADLNADFQERIAQS
jgi:hypothetical protein